MNDTRSTLNPANLQQILDAAVSPGAAVQGYGQQYSTPPEWAAFFASLLPHNNPATLFDPQCAGGNLLLNGWSWAPDRYGIDIDSGLRVESKNGLSDGGFRSLNPQPSTLNRLTANCVTVWQILDDLYPGLRFECQVANPPFGIRWKMGTGEKGKMGKGEGTSVAPLPLFSSAPFPSADSTAHTWAKITERAAEGGFGYFIANRATIERLGIHEHPWAYLYQTFPPGFWKGTTVEIGVVHWHTSHPSHPSHLSHLSLHYKTLDQEEHTTALAPLLTALAELPSTPQYHLQAPLAEAWPTIAKILAEERRHQPAHNIWLGAGGLLRVHLSTRHKITRKLGPRDIERLCAIEGCHPLTLTTEAETRKLLRELTGHGGKGEKEKRGEDQPTHEAKSEAPFPLCSSAPFPSADAPYSISPAARAAIDTALAEVAKLAVPIMPVTDFEKVAYADELEHLRVRADWGEKRRKGEKEKRGAENPPLDEAESDAPFPLCSFSPLRSYPLRTSTYTFVEQFTRNKIHHDEETDTTSTAEHTCTLTGQDRYIALVDDDGVEHRFMDRPPGELRVESKNGLRDRRPSSLNSQPSTLNHPESLLWKIFEQPIVPTLADELPAMVNLNKQRLLQMQNL